MTVANNLPTLFVPTAAAVKAESNSVVFAASVADASKSLVVEAIASN